MTTTLFILNEAPYGSERVYNGLRLAGALAGIEGQQVQVFLMADARRQAIASKLVKEIGRLGGDVSKFVTPPVEKALLAKFGR